MRMIDFYFTSDQKPFRRQHHELLNRFASRMSGQGYLVFARVHRGTRTILEPDREFSVSVMLAIDGIWSRRS